MDGCEKIRYREKKFDDQTKIFILKDEFRVARVQAVRATCRLLADFASRDVRVKVRSLVARAR